MTPAQFLARIKKNAAPPAALLLGPEAYERRRIREALAAAYRAGRRSPSTTCRRSSLAEVIDDARSLSLFASERLIWVVNAEAALPKGRAAATEDEDGEGGGAGDAGPLNDYLKNPTPGVVLVFEASRFDFEGDDKRKQDRVRKFYARHSGRGGAAPFSSADARREAESLVARVRFPHRAGGARAAGGSAGRGYRADRRGDREALAVRGGQRTSAWTTSRRWCRTRAPAISSRWSARWAGATARASLEILDTLTREGEYLPLALAFLSTQFRMALVAREAGLKSAQQIQGHFTQNGSADVGFARRAGLSDRHRSSRQPQLERAMKLIFEADRGLRDARPDDRIVMEQFILQLVG